MPLHRFGDASVGKLYDFTTAGRVFLGVYKDNFAQVDSITHKSPGMSGALDSYGRGVPPTKVGNIRQELEIRATSRTSIDTYRDELRAMVSWGKQRLYFRPENYPTQADRTCYAKCVKVDMSIDKNAHNFIQKVTIEWEVTDPRWCVPLSGGGLWGVGEWGTALWGVAPTIMSLTTLGPKFLDATLTYNGNVAAAVMIEIETGGSAQLFRPTIERIVDGIVVDRMGFNQRLNINQVAHIDARIHQVRYNYIHVNDERVSSKRARWFIVEPGSQIIRVRWEDRVGTPIARFWYDEYYR